jgi:hypothetical protein
MFFRFSLYNVALNILFAIVQSIVHIRKFSNNPESLGFWTLSIVQNSENRKLAVSETGSVSVPLVKGERHWSSN